MGAKRSWVPTRRRGDRGSIAVAVLGVATFIAIAVVAVAAALSSAERSNASTNDVLLTQRIDAAVGEALSALEAGTNPLTPADANTSCETTSGRSLCSLWWTDPIPADATDPLRYNVQIRTWVDQDRSKQPPLIEAATTAQDDAWPHVPGQTLDPSHVSASLVPVQAITYQTSSEVAPRVVDGQIHYTPSPPSLFTSALHAFDQATLQGVTARSYNSMTSEATGYGATIATDGTVAYQNSSTDRTVLFGGNSKAGDHNSRCTGDACQESDVVVLGDSHAAPTDKAVEWIRDKTGTTHNGDWISSQQGSYLPAGNHVINGNLVIDTNTVVHGNATNPTNLYVYGAVTIKAALNAPTAHGNAIPAGLRIFSAGNSVAIDPGSGPAGPGISIAALTYAPNASCGTSNTTNPVNYFGSLVCNTISISTEWNHDYDDGALLGFVDPVPGAKKAWTYAPHQLVDLSSYTPPAGWAPNPECIMPAPTGAGGYWKLDEAYGQYAADSSGNGRNGRWGTGGRDLGVCGYSAVYTPSGAVPIDHTLGNANNGVTLEYWARTPTGIPLEAAGYRIAHTAINKIRVTDQTGASTTVPFTVQNTHSWHLYAITISSSGTVNLYIDGQHKGTAPSSLRGTGISTGTALLGQGSQVGSIDEVVYYPRVLSASQIANRWTAWNDHPDATFTPTDPGTPFGAPTIRDNGTTSSSLRLAWTKPTGTFPSGSTYQLQVANGSNGPWSALGTVSNHNTLTFTQSNPEHGTFHYRVGATYNGDTRWSSPVRIQTLGPPTAAPTVSRSTITNTSGRFTWTSVTDAHWYEYRTRVNGGSWSGWSNNGTTRNATISRGSRHGDQITIQVRAANAAGKGPASSTVSAQTTVRAPSGQRIAGRSRYPRLEARVTNISCPTGTTVQNTGRVKWNTNAWPSYQGWTNGANSTTSIFYGNSTNNYSTDLDAQIQVRCRNTATGQTGPSSGNLQIMNIEHPMPRPTGVRIEAGQGSAGGFRGAAWQGTCPSPSSVRYDVRVRYLNLTRSYTINNTTRREWRDDSGVGWGGFDARVRAYCVQGGRTGSYVEHFYDRSGAG